MSKKEEIPVDILHHHIFSFLATVLDFWYTLQKKKERISHKKFGPYRMT